MCVCVCVCFRCSTTRVRVWPSLLVVGGAYRYSCEDHFYERDTEEHCWQLLAAIVADSRCDYTVVEADGDDEDDTNDAERARWEREDVDGVLKRRGMRRVCLRHMVIDVGMPVTHCGARYNCRVIVCDGKVCLIRPKMALADDGNYREPRWFAAWRRERVVEDFTLPPCIVRASCGNMATVSHAGGSTTNMTNGNNNMRHEHSPLRAPLSLSSSSSSSSSEAVVPFGDAVLRFEDTMVASETCEELFTPDAPHIRLALSGVEIFANGSGSHHELRKLNKRIELISSATAKAGGVYMYSNQRGCDGNRLYFDGCANVMVNGQLVAQGKQFSLRDVEVVTATVDLDDVATMRGRVGAFQHSAASTPAYTSVYIPKRLSMVGRCGEEYSATINRGIEPKYHEPEEEIAYGPACWLWDYLRRSGASGFLLPLSGGADSASTAAIVGAMCQLVVATIKEDGDADVIEDVRRICSLPAEMMGSEHIQRMLTPSMMAEQILTTVYMGTVNSSDETRGRAAGIANEIGTCHLEVRIDTITNAFVALLSTLFPSSKRNAPKFRAHGGSQAENIALQNIQARCRMVLAFFLAQLLPWIRGSGSFMLVLGSANVDEGLRGYMTKYDCSSADINPIGGISKLDLRRFLTWGASALMYPSLGDVEKATPTAELEPLGEGNSIAQTDEDDMGMTYKELGIFGRLRTICRCGPVAMYKYLLYEWTHLSPLAIAAKVQHFFRSYSLNRHKMCTVTPSYHAESYSPDDNRFDLRQFLYSKWKWQFAQMDALAVAAAERKSLQ